MSKSATYNVTDLSGGDRHSLEVLLGAPLQDGQQVLVMVVPQPKNPSESTDGLIRQFQGAAHSGNSSSADNEAIDSDLNASYGDTHM